MAKSKNRKDHKKRVAARNDKIKLERERFQKIQQKLFMELLEQERQKKQQPLFENMPQIPTIPSVEGPSLDPLQGPVI